MRRIFFPGIVSGALLLLLGCGDGLVQSDAAGLASGDAAAKLAVADQGGRPLTAVLTGAAEVPVPGDPDGSGSAVVTLNQGLGEVCFELFVEDIVPAVAAHIHVGEAGTPGGVVVGLAAPADGFSSGCVSEVDPGLIKSIRQNPAGYYVNVHNPEYPGGALRGQLGK